MFFFFFNDTATTEIYTLSLHDALPIYGLQNEHGVFDGASHGAELVERPAERHGSGARDAAVGGTKAGDAASHAGADDAAAGFAADGEADKAGGGGCARTGARARRTFFEKPRIHGLATEP